MQCTFRINSKWITCVHMYVYLCVYLNVKFIYIYLNVKKETIKRKKNEEIPF